MSSIKIDIDPEVFAFLQANATPLVDSPNDVLRRLLLKKNKGDKGFDNDELDTTGGHMLNASASSDPEPFVRELLNRKFGSDLMRRRPFRLMFESPDKLVYIQNFNKKSEHLWYRVTENPWKQLQSSKKKAWLCFTNPAERYSYTIPVSDVQTKLKPSGWNRSYLEVNIDPASHRWVELDWNIGNYLLNL